MSWKAYINLLPNPEDMELTEEELELVAGGLKLPKIKIGNFICFNKGCVGGDEEAASE